MAELFDALSDPTRLRILMQLRAHEEACVTDLAAWTNTNESAVSHALRLLRAHGIVESERSKTDVCGRCARHLYRAVDCE